MSSNPVPPVVPADAVEADPKKPYKAVAAFLLSLLGLIWASLAGRETLDDMTLMEVLSIVIPAVITASGVYIVRNPKVVDTDPQIPVNDRGALPPATALLVAGVVLAVIGLLVNIVWLLWVGVALAVVGLVLLLAVSVGART